MEALRTTPEPGTTVALDPTHVDLELLPLPALLTKHGVVASSNRAYREMVGLSSEEIVGHTALEIIRRTVHAADLLMFENLATRPDTGSSGGGHRWCRIVTPGGQERAVRVEWRRGHQPGETFTFLVEAQPEAYGQSVADTLARTAGGLGRCSTEEEILARAADSLAEQGFTVTVLLVDEGSPLLRYGPQRLGAGVVPATPRDSAWATTPPPRSVLELINPHFSTRRAVYYQDGMRLVREAYPEPIAADLTRRLPSTRMVQVPLFVEDRPFGAIVVTGDDLNPLVATALELFSELVGQALFNLRLRRERVGHERLAALGEAAAVMAHEVRNPVGAIVNAITLIERVPRDAPLHDQMLGVIREEAARLEHLVTQLLELGRPLAPRPRRVSLASLVAESVELLIARRECTPERISVVAVPPPADAELDPELAQLALVNVLHNALQATTALTGVQVTTELRDEEAGLIVDDAGAGIPAEIRRLGEPFFTTRASGTGMGLAVVRRILQTSCGRLVVGSSPMGGARVELWFPRAKTA